MATRNELIEWLEKMRNRMDCIECARTAYPRLCSFGDGKGCNFLTVAKYIREHCDDEDTTI